jgi:hypothetical protein
MYNDLWFMLPQLELFGWVDTIIMVVDITVDVDNKI